MSYTSPMYKTEHLSYKNGHAMWVMKCLIETGLQCYSKNFGLRLLYTTFEKCYHQGSAV